MLRLVRAPAFPVDRRSWILTLSIRDQSRRRRAGIVHPATDQCPCWDASGLRNSNLYGGLARGGSGSIRTNRTGTRQELDRDATNVTRILRQLVAIRIGACGVTHDTRQPTSHQRNTSQRPDIAAQHPDGIADTRASRRSPLPIRRKEVPTGPGYVMNPQPLRALPQGRREAPV